MNRKEGSRRATEITEKRIIGKLEDTGMDENQIGTGIVDCAVQLHQALGPGLLESVYEAILARELEKRGLFVQRQVAIPIEFGGERFEEGFRADLIVDRKVIVEVKSVEKINPAHKKQLLTYMKLANRKLGYLLNFGEALMKNGITRVIHGQLNPENSVPPCLREGK